MNDSDFPIVKKSFEFYKTFHEYRRVVPKADRFTIYERSENLILDMIQGFLEAGYISKTDKGLVLERTSVKLNTLRFLICLMRETKAIDLKKYAALQEILDEIGRMLGGWIRSASTSHIQRVS